jgi:hypothetical protein
MKGREKSGDKETMEDKESVKNKEMRGDNTVWRTNKGWRIKGQLRIRNGPQKIRQKARALEELQYTRTAYNTQEYTEYTLTYLDNNIYIISAVYIDLVVELLATV